ncbi:MAG: LapA family protein [Candidatus Aminicenantes bacterium]
MKAKAIIILILIVLAGIILIQNTQIVTVQLFFWKIRMSRIILISLSLLVGFVVGILIPWGRRRP